MQKLLLTCCLSGSAILPVYAQTADTTASQPEKPATQTTTGKAKAPEAVVPQVTVAAERPTNRIDRQVYEVKSDISTTNGTAADALNNVPSVSVDPDGTVSLRGSTNVQIMVDGKPSAMLQGDNRGPALQAMAAEDIESVEVVNNPGAEFGNEAGGGPILNLVMRRNRKPGGTATVNSNYGTAGRYNSAVNGSYNEGAWGFQGSASLRHDGRNSVAETSRDTLDTGTGQFVHSSQESIGKGLNDMVGLNGSVSYNVDPKDTLTGSLSYQGRTNDQQGSDHYINGATSLIPASDYVRTTDRTGDSKNFAWGGRYDHKGELPGETLKIDLRVSASLNDNLSDYYNDYTVPAIADTQANQHNNFSTRIIDFTGDYERPLWGGTAKAGYKVATNDNTSDTVYTDIDPATGAATINNGRTNRYALDETVYALYSNYQMRLSERWTGLAGLRAEYTDMDIKQITGDVEAKNHYINYMPSAFATYKLTADANLRFSYARRIRRPQAGDLNPYVTYRDEFNVSSGNPNLKPTKTDSFELGYETKFGGLETNLRGYYRKDTDAIVDQRYFIAPNVLLTTKANGEGSHSSGLEFSVSGKLSKDLTLNANGNLMRAQQSFYDDSNTLITRTANSLSGRVRLNYQLDAADQIQLALQARGKTLSGDGYRSPTHSVNLSLRHTVSPQLTLVANVTDLFNTNKMETIVDSATLRETSSRHFDGRVVYVGLSYRFGGSASSSAPKEEGWQGRGPRGPGPGGDGPGGDGPPPGA